MIRVFHLSIIFYYRNSFLHFPTRDVFRKYLLALHVCLMEHLFFDYHNMKFLYQQGNKTIIPILEISSTVANALPSGSTCIISKEWTLISCCGFSNITTLLSDGVPFVFPNATKKNECKSKNDTRYDTT